MTGTTQQQGASWRQMLDARPVRNRAARAEADDSTGMTITVGNRRRGYLSLPPVSWIVPFRKERRVKLDGLGAEVWRLCDGQLTVEGVVDRFSRTHGLTFHEARVAVTGYMKGLIRRGVLAIELDGDAWQE